MAKEVEEGEECWVPVPSRRSLVCQNPIRTFLEDKFPVALQRCDKEEIFKLATGKRDYDQLYAQL